MTPTMRETLLVAAKNLLYRVCCLGNDARYFVLKGRLMRTAARLGVYESAYVRLLPFFIRPGSDVLDVGANFGAYTCIMAKLVGPAGRVFAYEPFPPAAAILQGACARLGNVTIVPEIVSDRDTE